MIGPHQVATAAKHSTERRAHARHKITALSYIHLGQGNGGFVLDLSEGGLCIQPVAAFPRTEVATPIRFQLPHSSEWIESSGKAVWISEERTMAGLQFVALPDSARIGIRKWVEAQGQNGTLAPPPSMPRAPGLESASNMSRTPDTTVAAPISEAKGALPEAHSGKRHPPEGVTSAVPNLHSKDDSSHVPAGNASVPAEHAAELKKGPAEPEAPEGLPAGLLDIVPELREFVDAPSEFGKRDSVSAPKPVPFAFPDEASPFRSAEAPFAHKAGSSGPAPIVETSPDRVEPPLIPPAPAPAFDTTPRAPFAAMPAAVPSTAAVGYPKAGAAGGAMPPPLGAQGVLAHTNSIRAWLQRRIADEDLQVVVQLRHRWMLPVLMVLLVIVSFAVGVAVGHGFFDRMLGTAQPVQMSASPTTSPSAPSAASNSENTNQPATNDADNASSVPKPADDSKPAGRGTESSHAAAAVGSASHKQTFSAIFSKDDTTTFVEASHAVSATATIAINSERSVSLPSALVTTFDDSDPGFRFGALTNHTDPFYPPQAIADHVEGTVELHVSIARDGTVRDVQPVSGPQVLQVPAVAGVRTWRYNPTYVKGYSAETKDTLMITFRLPH